MKKHLVIMMNVVLIALVIGAIIFTVLTAINRKNDESAPDATESATQAVGETAATEAGQTYKIGIIQNGLGNASKACYEGFISELNERGLLEKVEIVYIVEDDKELCREKLKTLIKGGCDLLYTIGGDASKIAAEVTDEIPIVFGAVNNPDEAGLVESNETPGGNVTGVSSYTPCFEQIDLIRILLPKAKSVVAIYSATEEDSVMQGIIASKEAKTIGIDCDQYPVNDEKELKAALDKIKDAGTDVIYIPVDKFLSAHIDILNQFSYKNKIPVICGDEATLALGAFATSEINYNSIGRKAAGLAHDILFGGKSPAKLSVIYKHDCNNIVNKEIMKKLEIQLPATALGEIEMWEKPTEAEDAAVTE